MMENIENIAVEETMDVVDNVIESVSYKEAGMGFVAGVVAAVSVKLAKDHILPKAKAFFGNLKKDRDEDVAKIIDTKGYVTVDESKKEKENK